MVRPRKARVKQKYWKFYVKEKEFAECLGCGILLENGDPHYCPVCRKVLRRSGRDPRETEHELKRKRRKRK